MWHKPCRTFHPWCLCIKTRCLSWLFHDSSVSLATSWRLKSSSSAPRRFVQQLAQVTAKRPTSLALCEESIHMTKYHHCRNCIHDVMIFLWSAYWMNGWVNNREAGDLRRHRAHYDVIVMVYVIGYRCLNSCPHLACGHHIYLVY